MMSAEASKAPKIESADLTLQQVFKDFYNVPNFQREYVWEPENVVKLFEDVYDEFYDAQGRTVAGNEYFIGSIVTCPGAHSYYDLIDGQQRVTTVFLALCAMRDRLNELGAPPSTVMADCIRDAVLDPKTGHEKDSFRLVLQYEDSQDVLSRIAGGEEDVQSIVEATKSIEHIKNAYLSIKSFLDEKFGDDPEQIREFFGAFISRVKLIRIVTPHLSHALKVFETVNDRGIGLTAVDLLKNLLFMKASQADHNKLKTRWKKLVDVLDKAGEKPLRFLRYVVMSRFDGDWQNPLREDQIYDWFTRHVVESGIKTDPVAFADMLVHQSETYANLLNGKDPQGHPNPFITNISLISGRAARQHFILLLAAQHLPSPVFTTLCRRMESLLFCYTLIRESTKTFERNFAQWATRLRQVETAAELEGFLGDTIDADLANRSSSFDFAFRELSLNRIQNYKLKYILAKLTQHIEVRAWGNPSFNSLAQYVDRSVEIEHILPRTPAPEQRAAFDQPGEYDAWKQKLGNLVLLEKSINSSLSRKDFASKCKGYGQSKMLLTRSLHERPSVGLNTRIDQAVADLPEFDIWNSASIRKRQEALWKLARTVWLEGINSQAAASKVAN